MGLTCILQFQESAIHNNGSSAVDVTSFLAASKTLLEGNFSTTIPNVQIVRNSTFVLAENQTQSQVSLVDTPNHQNQCWETYVGQVCNCAQIVIVLTIL